MASHSSLLAWRIPWTEEPGGLQSMGSQRIGHDWSDLAWMQTAFCFSTKASPNDMWRTRYFSNQMYVKKIKIKKISSIYSKHLIKKINMNLRKASCMSEKQNSLLWMIAFLDPKTPLSQCRQVLKGNVFIHTETRLTLNRLPKTWRLPHLESW